jgi:hypothetical protein
MPNLHDEPSPCTSNCCRHEGISYAASAACDDGESVGYVALQELLRVVQDLAGGVIDEA